MQEKLLKYHKFISLIWGLVFLIVLQTFATPEPIFRFLVPAFVIYVSLITLYNRWYLRIIEKYSFWILLRPILLLISCFGLFLVIPSDFLRGLFLVVSVGIIAFFEIILGNFAENLLLNETLIIAFGLFFLFFALYHYLPGYGTWYLAGIFASSALLTRSFYEFTPKSERVKIIGAVTIGLFCSEIYWALNFLQFHFSALSIILFNIFYFCIILNYYFLFHVLNFKKIQFHLILICVTSLMAVLSTPWQILK